jgi:hypothetical protein
LHRLNELDKPTEASKTAVVRYVIHWTLRFSCLSVTNSNIRYPKPQTHLHEILRSPTQEEFDDAQTEDLRQLREDLAFELASPLGRVSYPENLTLYSYVDFVCCPTLCYELEYPRTMKIRWMEVFYKTLAIFGCIFLMVITTDEFILPVLDLSADRLHHSNSALDFGLILGETIGRLLFPFMITFLLVFLVIFEYVLGACAELTRFADREFYADWWNSCDWLEFCGSSVRSRGTLTDDKPSEGMEFTCASISPSPRLLGLEEPHVAPGCHHHNIPHLCPGTRAGHGLHHQEISWLRLHSDDASDAHRDGAAEQVGQRPHTAEQRPFLVQHDIRSEHDVRSIRPCLDTTSWRIRSSRGLAHTFTHCISSYRVSTTTVEYLLAFLYTIERTLVFRPYESGSRTTWRCLCQATVHETPFSSCILGEILVCFWTINRCNSQATLCRA